jgi:purine-binding chemotaxis protein CheW
MDKDKINEFLVFQLSHEEYAIDVLKIQEIRHYESIITIANSPPFLKGAMNIRGTIVPLIDLRILFHLEQCEYNERTIFIILNLEQERILGIVTDGVSDVIKLSLDQIKKTKEFNTFIHSDFISGVGILDTRALIIIDIEKLFSLDELHGLGSKEWDQRTR